MAVGRTEAQRLDEFEGVVKSVALEPGIDDRRQYHIEIEPTTFKVGGATGKLHEWIPLSPKATDENVPQGSVMDKFLMQLEICLSKETKNVKTVSEEMALLVNKKFRFKRLKLGRDFDGKPAREYIVPVAIVQ